MEFEKIDDESLQLYPLVVTVFDADTNDLVGVVQLDMTPHTTIIGWFPVYSVHNGIMGDLRI